jgi:ATP-dependent helicase IRC3
MSGRGRRQLVVLPTGCGKTLFALQVAATARQRGHRVLWLAHREELLDQPMRSLQKFWPDLAQRAGVVQAHRDAWYEDLIFASIDTVARRHRLESVLAPGPPRLVVVDEAHHSAAGSWSSVLDCIDEFGRDAFADVPGPDDPLYLGLTATPDRADGKPLGRLWRVAFSYPIQQAIKEGWLVPPTFAAERLELDLSKVSQRAGDWADNELEDALMQAHVVEHTAAAMQKCAAGRKSLVFTVTVHHAEETAKALNAAGIAAAVVSGETPKAQRRELLQALRDGRIRALCNCAVLTEGYDDPSVDCVTLARPTRSHPLYVQMVGRGLRLSEGKRDCLVLDLVGASAEHSLHVSSALLTEGAEPAEQREQREPGGGEREGGRWQAFFEDRRRSRYAWAEVPEVQPRAWALNAGDEGTVALVEQPDGGFLAVVLRKGGGVDYPAGRFSLDHETAAGCAEDFVRQADAAALVGGGRKWRREFPTGNQRDLLQRLRIAQRPRTRGEAERLITGKFTQSRLVQLGLVERVRVPEQQGLVGVA